MLVINNIPEIALVVVDYTLYLVFTARKCSYRRWPLLAVSVYASGSCPSVCLSVPFAVVKVDRRIRWHYTTAILRFRIGARLTRYRNCKLHNFARTISRYADGISRYSVPPSAGPLLPLSVHR